MCVDYATGYHYLILFRVAVEVRLNMESHDNKGRFARQTPPGALVGRETGYISNFLDVAFQLTPCDLSNALEVIFCSQNRWG